MLEHQEPIARRAKRAWRRQQGSKASEKDCPCTAVTHLNPKHSQHFFLPAPPAFRGLCDLQTAFICWWGVLIPSLNPSVGENPCIAWSGRTAPLTPCGCFRLFTFSCGRRRLYPVFKQSVHCPERSPSITQSTDREMLPFVSVK